MTAEELKKYVGKRVRLGFREGFEVEAMLISVEPEHEGTELVYDPYRVISPGSNEPPIPSGAVLVDSLSDLRSCAVIDDSGSVG